MSDDQNAQIARTVYGAFNKHEFDRALEYVSDDSEAVVYPQDRTFQGREGFREMMDMHKAPWPDGTVEVIRQLSSPEGVANECIYRATHTEPLPLPDGSTIPPTGKRVELRFCEIWRITDGKVVSLHNYGDNLPVMQQLGLLPAPDQIPA